MTENGLVRGLTFALLALAVGRTAASAGDPPQPWAFVVKPPGLQPAPDDGSLRPACRSTR
jgi:hypothetical protein